MQAISLFTLVAVLLPLTAQQGSVSKVSAREESTIKLNARVVNLNVKVSDQTGRPVPRLKPENFIVLEDNIRQEITYFQPIAAPVNLLLLLDLSGSIGGKLHMMKKAAKKF